MDGRTVARYSLAGIRLVNAALAFLAQRRMCCRPSTH